MWQTNCQHREECPRRRWHGAGDRLLRPGGRNRHRRCRRAGCHASAAGGHRLRRHPQLRHVVLPGGPDVARAPVVGNLPGGLVAPVLLTLNSSIQQSIRSTSETHSGVSAGTKTAVASRFDLPHCGSAWRTGLPGGCGSSRSAARPRSVLPPESPRRSTSDQEPLWHRRWPSLLTGRCAPVPGSDRAPERRLHGDARVDRGRQSLSPWNHV
jgi:hypothetical protein